MAATSLAVRHCEQLVHDGADILDIGGESTAAWQSASGA